MNTARDALGGAGTQTAAVAFGGAPYLGVSEEWNGSAWAEGNDLNTARNRLGSAGTSQTAGLGFMGKTSPPAAFSVATESYDGTAWHARPNAATARGYVAGCGTLAAALAFGGWNEQAAATEEFTGVATLKTVTDS